MLKTSKLALTIGALCVLFLSCKKEPVAEAVKFSFLNVDNKTTYNTNDLLMTYESRALNENNTGFKNIKVPAGIGKLAIEDSTGKSLLDTSLNFIAGKTINWVLFQPSGEVKPVILEDNGSLEPQPDAEHIKVKFAHFVPKAFPRPIDIIFYWFDPNTFELIEGGRVDNVNQNFHISFNEVLFKESTSSSIVIMPVDHESQQPLLDDIYLSYSTGQNQRILTLYLAEDAEYGSPVTGTPYKIKLDALFVN
jgi:hypothetical protein